jgi:hypothetical protein
MELVMRIDNKSEPHALFKSTSGDGIQWLFIILSDDQWAITRNAERIASGTADNASIKSGVEKFLSFSSNPATQTQSVSA